jgi:hypothetical protein
MYYLRAERAENDRREWARARAMEADAPKLKRRRRGSEGAGADSATRVRDSARSGSPKHLIIYLSQQV